jgi:hypothetical protein
MQTVFLCVLAVAVAVIAVVLAVVVAVAVAVIVVSPQHGLVQLPGYVSSPHDEQSVLLRSRGSVYLGHELCLKPSRGLVLGFLGGGKSKAGQGRKV